MPAKRADFEEVEAEDGSIDRLTVDFVFDIEVESWDRFVCGGILTREGFHVHWHENEDRYIDHLLSLQGIGWAHYGGRYDAIHFVDHLARRGVEAELVGAGGGIIQVRVGDLCLRDSFAVIPLPLSDASKIGSIQKVETGLPCVCNAKVHCGGYCSIRRDMSPVLRRKLAYYLELDCRSTMSMLDALGDYCDKNELDLRMTIGASAWRTAKRLCELRNSDWKASGHGGSTIYDMARRAYYGGRVQCFRPRSTYGYRYDINSAYPAALSQIELPTGKFDYVSARIAREKYRKGFEGIFEARVEVSDDTFIPPLPVRSKDRIYYPIGRFVSWFTGNELRYAEQTGVKVEDVGRALVWTEREKKLKPFVDYLWRLRDEAGPKTALGKWLKLYSNSITGKFGQSPLRDNMAVNPTSGYEICDGQLGTVECHGVLCGSDAVGCCEHQCSPMCSQAHPLDKAMKIWTKRSYRIPSCGHVQYGAYLTSSTRIELHRQMLSYGVGGTNGVYCDTDSVYSEEELTRAIGIQLGEWKPEGPYSEFECVAPKTYRFIDAETGELVGHSKGIPNAAKNFDSLIVGSKIQLDRGVLSLRAAARSKVGTSLFQRKSMERAVSADGVHFGDRVLGEDGRTYPTDVSEIERILV